LKRGVRLNEAVSNIREYAREVVIVKFMRDCSDDDG